MISKQNEQLCLLRNILVDTVKYDDLLLENFFYSLTPAIMRSVLDPVMLKTLFLMFLNVIDERFLSQDYIVKIQRELDFVYAIIRSKDSAIKEELGKALSKLNYASNELAMAYVNIYDTPCLGYIYRSDDPYKQEHFCQTLQYALEGAAIR
jgi:hypothetical protein